MFVDIYFSIVVSPDFLFIFNTVYWIRILFKTDLFKRNDGTIKYGTLNDTTPHSKEENGSNVNQGIITPPPSGVSQPDLVLYHAQDFLFLERGIRTRQ